MPISKISFEKAINDINEYVANTDFDVEYLENIYEYLLNKKIKIKEGK